MEYNPEDLERLSRRSSTGSRPTPPSERGPIESLPSSGTLSSVTPTTLSTPASSQALLPSTPSSTSNMAQPVKTMPLCTERDAPKFDPSNPRTLPRYFDDLQLLFTRHGITDTRQQKSYAIKYITPNDADYWGSFDSYTDAAKTFEEFKTEVLDSYPGASELGSRMR